MSSRQDRSGERPGTPAYRVPALERGLDVLELLAARAVPMTQADIARALGRSPGEVFRTLTALDGRGYLHRDPVSGAYALTLRLAELSRRHQPHEGLLRAAERPMRALMEETGESCHLSILHRGQLVVLAQEEGPARVRLSVAMGSTIWPRQAASGRVLLAALDPRERERALMDDPGWAPLNEPERESERARLTAIGERGHEAAWGETVAGVSDLSVLVGSPGAAPRAALAIAALPRDHDVWTAATLPLLHRRADEIVATAGLAGLDDSAGEG